MQDYNLNAIPSRIRADVKELIQRPDFDKALVAFVEEFHRPAIALGGRMKGFGDIDAVMLSMWVLGLHAAKEDGRVGHGATTSILQEIARRRGYSSPRHVNTWISQAVADGHLERVPSDGDLRVFRLVPQTSFVERCALIVQAIASAVDTLKPESKITSHLGRDTNVIMRLCSRVVDGNEPRAFPAEGFTDFRKLTARNAGLPILISCIVPCIERYGKMATNASFPISVRHTSSAFGVSPGHVRNFLRQAIDLNYFVKSEGGYELTLKLKRDTTLLLATHMAALEQDYHTRVLKH